MLSANWRQEVCDEARTWLWTPYRHKGRVKGVGVDCGGILYEIYNPHFGPFKPFPADYPPDWALHKDGHELYLDFIMPYVKQVESPVAGGFSLFKYGRVFSHAALFMNDGRYLHAWGDNKKGTVKLNRPEFFRQKNGTLREAKHFDVSDAWASKVSAQ